MTTVVTEHGAVVEYEYVGDDTRPVGRRRPGGGRSELPWEDGLLIRVVDPTGVTVTFRHDEFGDLVSTDERASATPPASSATPRADPSPAVSPSGAAPSTATTRRACSSPGSDADGARLALRARAPAPASPRSSTRSAPAPSSTYGAARRPADRPPTRWVARRHAPFDDQGTCAVARAAGRRRLDVRARRPLAPPGRHRPRPARPGAASTTSPATLTATVDPTGVRQEFTTDLGRRHRHAARRVRDDDACASTSTAARLDVHRPTAPAELITYDAAGRPVELVDGEGGLTRLERDLAGRVVAFVSPSGARTTYEYDACGRPVAATDAARGPHHAHATTPTRASSPGPCPPARSSASPTTPSGASSRRRTPGSGTRAVPVRPRRSGSSPARTPASAAAVPATTPPAS